MKEKIKKEYLRRTRKLLKIKLYSRILIKRINTRAVPLVRYLGPFLKGLREELKQIDQRTRKLIMMHKALHRSDDTDRWYMSRKECGRGLVGIEDNIDALIRWLKDYIEKGRLITATRNNTDNKRVNWTNITKKQKWKEKQLYRHLKQQMSDISHEKTW